MSPQGELRVLFFGDECLILYSYRQESKWRLSLTRQVLYVILRVESYLARLFTVRVNITEGTAHNQLSPNF